MSKYLGYVCLYTHKKESLFDTPLEMLHFRYIQKFNFVQKKLKCDGVGRINLIMTDNPVEHLQTERFSNVMDILFFVDKKMDTHREIYTFYKNILTDIWIKYKFDLVPLQETINQLNDFHQPWDYCITKNMYNNSKTCAISLKMHVDANVELYLIIHQPKDVNRLVLFSKINLDIDIAETLKHYCNKKYWKTDSKFMIELDNHRDYWEYDVETDTVNFIYPRAEENNPHGLYDLGMLYREGRYVLQDMNMAKYFLELSAARGYSKAEKALKTLAKL